MRAPLVALVALVPALASSQEPDAAPPPSEKTPSYDHGEMLPLGLRAERHEVALVTTSGGYDGARKAGTFDIDAELHIWGPIYLRAGGSYVSSADDVRPTVGALVTLFQAENGLAGAVGVFYKPEGLTEPEGEIEATFAMGLRLDATTLVANLTYGQDGEGNERDGEVRLGGTYRLGKHVYAGADARFRFSLGTSKEDEPDYDLLAGPLVSVLLLDTALTAQVGVSAVKLGTTETGAMALFGIARVF